MRTARSTGPRLRWHLAASLAPEDNPRRKIIGEVLKSVFNSGFDKDYVVWLEPTSLAALDELPTAADDDIQFVLLMRPLSIFPIRGVEAYLHCSVT